MILQCSHISKSFATDVVLNDVSFHINDNEKAAIVGVNGSGKSTLLKIIVGKEGYDSGDIIIKKDASVGYLAQNQEFESGESIIEEMQTAKPEVKILEKKMHELSEKMNNSSGDELDSLIKQYDNARHRFEQLDGYSYESEINGVLKGLGFEDNDFSKPISKLSGGQKTRVALAKMLLQNPDILLLDEPTNYLDEEHIAWLKEYLLKYENAFILISHDMEFLNDVVNIIYHVENAHITRYVGDYNEFLRLYELGKKQLEAAYNRQQNEINSLQTFIAKNKARVATAGMARARQKKLDKMDIIELAKEKPKPEFRFVAGRTSDKLIFETKDLVIGYDKPLSKPLNLLLERGQKVAVVGSNGIGKTTLLRSLLGEIKPISGSVELGGNQLIGYFEQEIKSDNTNTCIDDVWNEFPSLNQGEVRGLLAKCGLTTDQIESKVYVLSGGEQAKVRLCKIMNKETNILVLDEPTNHLDVDAKDELKRVLKEYKGTILMVCHEPEFYKDICTEIWDGSNFK